MLRKFLNYLSHELNRAPLTVEAYQLDIGQFQEWLAPGNPDSVDFRSVTTSDVRAWLSSIAKEGDTPRTLRRKIISLRSLFKWMVKEKIIDTSPVSNIPLPKIPKPLPDLIKASEIEEAIRKTIEENPDSPLKGLIIEMLYSLGIRRAELIGLNDSDISFFNKEIKVTGKRSKQRVVPVPQELLDKIRSWQQYRDNNEEVPSGSSPLFVMKGKRISVNQVYKIVREGLTDTTARKKSPHALRHSFASGMLNGGADIDSVREFLGHSSLSTTQIYTHISLNEIKKAYSAAHPRSNPNNHKK